MMLKSISLQNIFLTFLTIFTFYGCANTSNYQSPFIYEYTKCSSDKVCIPNIKKSYELNKKMSAFIGNSILSVSEAHYICRKDYCKSTTYPFIAIKSYKAVKKGNIYPVYKRDKNGTYYILVKEYCPAYNTKTPMFVKVDSNGKLKTNDLTDDTCTIKNYFNNEKIFKRYTNKLYFTKTECDEDKLCPNKKFLSMELIYSGKSENIIKIDYREYLDKMARQAFYQHLTYDLTESKIIRFKNFKIKIIKATNEKIEYVILQD